MQTILSRIVSVDRDESTAVGWSFAYFFCLLASYTMLRPLREEMGILGGVENLQWVFTGTFVAMLAAVPIFGWAASRWPRNQLLPAVYLFFVVNLLAFYFLFRSEISTVYVARAFFIWLSVYNLFVVSVFWSFMADLFTNEQARRLFGFIAAGGSLGAFAGPALTALLATSLGTINLLPLSAMLLSAALVAIGRLNRWAEAGGRQFGRTAIGGGIWNGVTTALRSPYLLGICVYIVLYTTLSTFLYFEQAHIVKAAIADSDERTRLFAIVDATVNILALGVQMFLTGRLIARIGVTATLAVAPAIAALGFLLLGVAPALIALLAFQILHRAVNHAIAKPAREILFTVVSREEKYKSKNFIDTVVYRGGDAASGWFFAGLTAMGLGLSAISFVAAPIALVWLLTAITLGREQESLRNEPVERSKVVREHA
ncbi:MAG: NTP/NDP exchange transporter [Burkholderiales bacterium]